MKFISTTSAIAEEGLPPRSSSSFPSLSVYISCQELDSKGDDDTGNTVSISIPDIANVSELRINEQVEKNDRPTEANEDDNDDDDVVFRSTSAAIESPASVKDDRSHDEEDSSDESDPTAGEETEDEDSTSLSCGIAPNKEDAGIEEDDLERTREDAEDVTDRKGAVFCENSEMKDVVDEKSLDDARKGAKLQSLKRNRPNRHKGKWYF